MSHFSFEQFQFITPRYEYREWINSLPPRTCLTVHWLADLGALPEPGRRVRAVARRFYSKTRLIEIMIVRSNEDLIRHCVSIIDNGDLNIYVAWMLWMRYVECIPKQFVLPGGRKKVLAWVRTMIRRPELNDKETEIELQWQVERMFEDCGYSDPQWPEVNN